MINWFRKLIGLCPHEYDILSYLYFEKFMMYKITKQCFKCGHFTISYCDLKKRPIERIK